MINIKFKGYAYATVFILFSASLFSSCKKNSDSPGGGNISAEYFLSATIDGKPWSANIKNGEENVAGGTRGGFMFVVGAQVTGKDTTAIVLTFPASPALNTQKSFDMLQKSVAGYINVAHTFSADAAVGGSGTYMITTLNDSSRVIEGKFSFKGVNKQNSTSVSVNITDGKFRTTYRDNVAPQPPDNLHN